MTKRNGARSFGPSQQTVEFSSGVKGFVTPLEIDTLRAVEEMCAEKYPYPDRPVSEVETLDGGTETLPIGPDDLEYEAWEFDCKAQDLKRAALWTDFVIEHCLEIEGVESEDDQQGLIDAFAKRRAIAEATGKTFDGTDWEITVRHFVLASQDDYFLLGIAARHLQFPNVSQDEVMKRVNSFRPFMELGTAAKSRH